MLGEFLVNYIIRRHPKKVAIAVGISVLFIFACAAFSKDTTSVGADKKDKQEIVAEQTISDTLLWFNGTYAILTTANGQDIYKVGGYDKESATNTTIVKNSLESWWGITNKEEAQEMITWLTEEGGHNVTFLEEYHSYELENYTREELIEAVAPEDKAYFLCLYDAVEKYGENAIVSWDLERAMQLLGWFYIADYYTYEEAMDKSLEIAKRIQSTYNSWDEMMESYFYGFQYWNDDDPEDTTSDYYRRRQIYEELKAQENSPYSLPWDLEFQKDW